MNRHRYIIFFLASLIYLVLVYIFWNYSIDDAFVTFRYAENFANGYGLVFNVGDKPVEGYSNFLWLLILTVTYKIGLPTYFTAKVIGVISFYLSALFWFKYFNRAYDYLWLTGPFMLVLPYTSFWAVSGLELGLYTLILTGLSIALFRNSNWTLLFFPLLVLVRPEGFLIGAVILVVWYITTIRVKREGVFRYIFNVVILLVTFVFLVFFRMQTFGYPMPNTFYAKSTFSIISLMEFVRPLIYFLPLTLLFIYGLAKAISAYRKYKELTVMALSFLAMAIVSCLASPVMNFHFRYLIAFFPFFLAVSFFALTQFKNRRLAGIFAAAGAIALFIPTYGVYASVNLERKIVGAQEELIEFINQQPDGISISLTDVGRIPYYTSAKYNDIWGLVSEDVAHQGFNALREYLRFPDYFVFVGYIGPDGPRLRFGMERLITKNMGFNQAYHLAGAGLPDGAVISEPGYYYLIFRKDQEAVDSLLEIYPID